MPRWSARSRSERSSCELANLAKSRFLAAASHDLRQPLHALNLFADQLRADIADAKQERLIGQIRSAVAAMNELFDALLDISKLDAGVLEPSVAEFPIAPLLKRIEATFLAPAREKGLRLRVLPSDAWVRSDPILLERILLNLVSNAVKYTGARRRGRRLPAARRSASASRSWTAASASPKTSSRQSSASSLGWQGQGRQLLADWALDWPSSIACPACSTIRSR